MGTVLIESTQIRWFSEQSGGRLDLKKAANGAQTKLKRDHQVQVHSDQMVLMMVWRETGSHERQPKTLNGESENNSRMTSDLVRKFV
jgi:hypothetical protein